MTRLVFLGGFLGSGKTTTLLRLAQRLVADGKRVGVLTNDQGQELVDTELFRAVGLETRDVRGGCFCCRLDDFVAQAAAFEAAGKPDVLLAEPVGSCTDLVATVLRPLRHLHAGAFEIAPFTVLIDPARARDALSANGNATLSEKITYIYRLQQMEAQAIAFNKVDLLRPDERVEIGALLRARFPAQRILGYSARTGEGSEDLAAWLLGPSTPAFARSPEIDYDVYAAGEAELAWFDGRFAIRATGPLAMDAALMRLGAVLHASLTSAGLEVGHVKLLLRAGDEICALSISSGRAPPEMSRTAGADAASLELLVNARVAAHPDRLRSIVDECLRGWGATVGASLTAEAIASFSPPRPVPTMRIE